MIDRYLEDGVIEGRLDNTAYKKNFADAHPALDQHEVMVAADRCYFCYDAPCVTACPTAIDIPKFILQISTGNVDGAARTIFEQNIFGGMCARVCPTETLCEQACVRQTAEGQPVDIGLLQRHATDYAMQLKRQYFQRAADTGKSIAIIGAGTAGLACAHRLAMRGHTVIIHDANTKPGGLNEFGIATYKTVDQFAQREVEYVTSIGGIAIINNSRLEIKASIDQLLAAYDAVFLGVGLGGARSLGADIDPNGMGISAVDFIAKLRQTVDIATIPIGRRVLVIGGGMTAVDTATQAQLLGAQEVTIAYRRGKANMRASLAEQNQASSKGVTILHWMRPAKIIRTRTGSLMAKLEFTSLSGGKLVGTGKFQTFETDVA